MSHLVVPGQTIGIIGGGHLARMTAFTAKIMGFTVGILDPDPECAAAQAADWQMTAKFSDREALMDFALKSDVIIYEYERIDPDVIQRIGKTVPVPQGTELLSIAQDRLLERAYLEENNINIAPYATIVSVSDIEEAISSIGFPCVLKSIRSSYDDKGEMVLYGEEDIPKSVALLRTGTCVLEAWIPFEREISVILARNSNGEMAVFPVAENVYRGRILHETIVPARIDPEVENEAKRLAKQIAEGLNVTGVFGIGMLVASTGAIYVNKLVPRPPIFGNYSIESCTMSQFQAHVRAVCGWPLTEVELLTDVVTVNVLAKHMEGTIRQIQLKPDWNFHYYGKRHSNENQKVGHITVLTEDMDRVLETIADTRIWE